ncbi:hypothetical protein D9758_010334 [Tetrapyrgos nigripes]|uniref:Uncharacterized protein n=1 Tax=Tetrapyrgos nigripes TaxID=182062 RepID=A0A8H5D270_9AGAR|nr:hypothetical protein D9758_010334 [Tetrapyrgos nigripes]
MDTPAHQSFPFSLNNGNNPPLIPAPAPSIPPKTLHTFLGLELAGAVGMTIILFTAIFSSRVKRCSTWYTFCASWIVSCLSYCLLFFFKETKTEAEAEPIGSAGSGLRKGVCVTQAALVYSVPTLTACTTLSLLIHGWYNVHFGLSRPPLESDTHTMIILLTIPVIIWFLMFIGFLVTGLQNPSIVQSSGLYCSFMSIMPAKISSLFVIVVTFSTVPIQASLALSLLRNFDSKNATSSISVQTITMVIRVLTFSFLILIGFAEGVIHLLTAYRSSAVDLIMASLPLSGVVIFGIQRDLFDTWGKWTGLALLPSLQLFKFRFRPSSSRSFKPLGSVLPFSGESRVRLGVQRQDTVGTQTQVTVTSDCTKSYL